MNRFGNYLYSLRKEKHMTQAELADLLGITNKAVSKWETGEAFPETAQLVPLADIFGVSVDDLLRGGPAYAEEKKGDALSDGEVPRSPAADQACTEEEIGRLAQKFRPENWNTKFAVWIGIGVVLAVAGIVALIISGVLTENENVHICFTVCMLAGFTLAADIFTAAGIVHERYFLPVDAADWKKRVCRFVRFMIAGITFGGAGICVFLSGALFAEGGTFENRTWFAVCIGGGLALFALAAFCFVYGGITWDTFCKKICEKEYGKEKSEILQIIKENEWKEDSLASKLCSAIMIVATAVFLLLGFLWDLWAKAWVAFVVGGLLCGIVEVWLEKKKK